jgi:hypothetical protein
MKNRLLHKEIEHQGSGFIIPQYGLSGSHGGGGFTACLVPIPDLIAGLPGLKNPDGSNFGKN